MYEEHNQQQEQLDENNKVTVVTADIHTSDTGTASWDYLEHEPSSLKNKTEFAPLAIVAELSRNENNLRHMLKNSFGASNNSQQDDHDSNPIQTDIHQTDLNSKTNLYEPVGMEHNIEYEVNFLAEYATKKSLFDNVSPILPQVLDKSGNKVPVTEDVFRADIQGTLNRLDKKRKNASPSGDMNASDSGIASPPPGGDVSIIRAPSTVNFTEDLEPEDRADSGLDNNENKPKIGVPKRDTMIRELKSKLKQRFQVEDQLLEEPTSTPVARQDRVPVGTVEAKKKAMNEKLARVFANKQTQSNVNGSLNPNTSEKGISTEKRVLTNFAQINQTSRQNSPDSCDSCSECGDPIGKSPPPPPPASREMLYGPGGLFGPKGPFSTPHVRYPNGMETSGNPPRKSSSKFTSRYLSVIIFQIRRTFFYIFLYVSHKIVLVIENFF